MNLLSLPEEAAERLTRLRALSDEWQVMPYDIWVNPAFYRFQLGDYRWHSDLPVQYFLCGKSYKADDADAECQHHGKNVVPDAQLKCKIINK